MDKFVHLHSHTGYSLLDGMSTIPDLVEKVVKDGSPGVAVTDHGTMAGMIPFAEECKKAGIKAIPGVEFYHVPDRHVKKRVKGKKLNGHLTALAMTDEGYRNLMFLSSHAHIEGKMGKFPRIDDDLLSQHSSGILLTSGCMSSLVSQHILEGRMDAALEQAAQHRDMVGAENYFIEIQNHGIPEQVAMIPHQLELAKKLGAPLVATNDSHYTDKDDALPHQSLLCINTKSTLSNPAFTFGGNSAHYLKSAREMRELFPEHEFPGACDNTLLINEMCEANIELYGDYLLPEFIPENNREVIEIRAKDNDTSIQTEALRDIVEGKAMEIYGKDGVIPTTVQDRIDHELNIIDSMGFPDYFLILADCVKWAKESGILVGAARGCLTRDTMVITKDGYKNIDDVVIGDEVVTHKNRWRPVENTFTYDVDEELVKVYSWQSGSGITMTGDHKVLSCLRIGDNEWVPASDLTPHHYVVVPRMPAGDVKVDGANELGVSAAHGQHVDIDNWDMESLREFVNGYISIDGYYDYMTIDYLLACYSCGFTPQENIGMTHVDEDYIYIPIMSVEKKHMKTTVYDIQVEQDHSFMTDEFIVHNSAGGSLVAYLADITAVDPLEYDLLFERFLNPDRSSMPDIDIDFDPSRRWEVVQYMADKYGKDHVAYISTYMLYKMKMSIRDAARVLDYEPSVGDALASSIPNADATDWGEAPLADYVNPICPDYIKNNEKMYHLWQGGEDLRSKINTNPIYQEVINLAMKINGNIRQAGQHPAGVLFTPTELWNHVPLREQKKVDEGKGQADIMIAEYDMDAISAIGGLKFDFLMIVNLPVIKRAIDLIKTATGKDIDIDNLPKDDAKVYDLISQGKTSGVFQLESNAAVKMCKDIQPDGFHDLYNILAINRPGPLASGMDVSYAKRKAGTEKITMISDELDAMMDDSLRNELRDVLDDSYGLLITQEAIMKISQIISGYTTAEADNFRRVISKKKVKDLVAMKDDFFTKGIARGHTKQFMQKLWDILLPFADYCFNKSHAVGYAIISYQTAWLKAHYPAQFTAACLDYFDKEKIPVQIDSARDLGIGIQSPDINKSGQESYTVGNDVLLGMKLINGIGNSAISKFIEERGSHEFTSLYNLVYRTQGIFSESQIASLIKVGATDCINKNRRALLTILPDVVEEAKKAKKDSSKFFSSDMDSLFSDIEEEVTISEPNFHIPDIDNFTPREIAILTRENVGFYLGDHPCHEMRMKGAPKGMKFPDELTSQDANKKVTIVGMIDNIEKKLSKKGRVYHLFRIDAGREPLSGMMFQDEITVSNGDIVAVNATVKEDDFGEKTALKIFANDITSDFDETPVAKPQNRKAVPRGDVKIYGLPEPEEERVSLVTITLFNPKDLRGIVSLLSHSTNPTGAKVVFRIGGKEMEAPFSIDPDVVSWDSINNVNVRFD